MEQQMSNFITPAAEFRGKPFWSWNGELDPNELVRQIGIMKKMGFGGFFIHSRIGLQDEYLGEKWMAMVDVCVKEAKKYDMEVWLYDEDRWPSGFGGGLVVDKPEYATKYIAMETLDGNDFIWDNKYIAVFACDLEGVEFSNQVRITESSEFSMIRDRKILAFSVVYQEPAPYYNNSAYLDTLNPDATRKFIQVTHEKYKGIFESEFGKSIKGIFTDEPTRGALLDGFAVKNPGSENFVPWTYNVFELFIEKYGYDVVEKLPDLFLKEKGSSYSQVKWHYIELLQQLFLENFLKPIHDWCKENKLLLTGHLIDETTLYGQTAMCGSIMRCYEYMDYPGTDVLTKKLAYASVKQLSSAARQTGKKKKLSELYGITGWEFPFTGHKHSGDWQALMGIDFRCHHLSLYTMKGLAKRDCPGSILHQSAWWKEYAYVEDYFSRIGTVLGSGKELNDLLVINPVESVWGKVYAKSSNWLAAMDEEIIGIDHKYQELLTWLLCERIGFDIGDEEMLSRMYTIGTDHENTPVLYLGQTCYKAVLVSGLITIRSSTIKILEEFLQAGGKVVFTEEIPAFVDGLRLEKSVDIFTRDLIVPRSRKHIIDGLNKEGLLSCVRISDTGGPIDDILCQLRKDENRLYLFVLNTSEHNSYINVDIMLKSQGVVQEWDCKTGGVFMAEAFSQGEYTHITADFHPMEEKMYVIGSRLNSSFPKREKYKNPVVIKQVEQQGYCLNEPNVCVLDMAEYKIAGEEWHQKEEILKVEQKVRNRFGLSQRQWLMDQPWHSPEDYFTGSTLILRYAFDISKIVESTYELVLENPQAFNVWINGKMLNTDASSGYWIDKSFKRFPILKEWLQYGQNTIEMETKIHEKMELEAIYILGEFSVELEGSNYSLSVPEENLGFSDITKQGYPFYGGSYTYKLAPPPEIMKGQRCFISIGEMNAACAKVYNNKGQEKTVAYPPYEVDISDLMTGDITLFLEVIPTRRNTFGPLHLSEKTDAYLPDAFYSEGEAFSRNYCLFECGLTRTPEFVIRSIV